MAFTPLSKQISLGQDSPITNPSVFIDFTSKAWTGETPDSVTKQIAQNIWDDLKRATGATIKRLLMGVATVKPPSELDYIMSQNKAGVTKVSTILHDNEPDRITFSLTPYSISKEVAVLPPGTPVVVKGRNRKGTWLYIEGPDNLSGYVVAQRIKLVTAGSSQTSSQGLSLGPIVAGAAAVYLLSQ